MVRRKKKFCSNHSNDPDEPPRRRVKKRDEEAEEEFQKEVQQGAQFLDGIVPEDQNRPNPPPIPHDEPVDDLYDQFMPILPPPIQEDQDEVDGVIVEFVTQRRAYRYAQARERLRKQWAALEDPLTAAYLQCQTRTSNWTTKSSYLKDVSDVCKCTADRFAAKTVRFCRCLPEPVQLVYKGYLPASPQHPQTAFSIPLLQLYHCVWQTSVSAATSFFEGIMNFHDSRVRQPLRGRTAPG
ncbi:hypothetical protein DFH28DRAFT_842223, partial [Melampsora americana]